MRALRAGGSTHSPTSYLWRTVQAGDGPETYRVTRNVPSYLNARSIAIWFVVLLAFLAVWGVFLPLKARGQDHHHPLHKDFYRTWLQPGTNISCCNARVEVNGVETGDCEPVKAEVRAGNWWAWLRQESRWIEIPDSRIIRERNPEQGGQQGHLCYSYGRVLCFVPPDSGG